MQTIDSTYFYGELSLAFPDTPAATANMQLFIDSKEADILQRLFGYELYKGYIAGIVVTPTPDARYTDLLNGKEYTNKSGVLTKWTGLRFTVGTSKKSLIANFVYWHYQADNYTFTTGSSEKKTDLAVNANPEDKMNRAWNEMVKWNCQLNEFLTDQIAVYPEYKNVCLDTELFTFKNRLGF